MRNNAALFVGVFVLVVSACQSYTDPKVSPSTHETATIPYQPESLPFVLNTPSGARSGTVEAAVGFDTKGHAVKIKLSQDPLLAARTDYVVWYASGGKLKIHFENQVLQSHVTCHQRTCYMTPADDNFPIGVYRYTIKVQDHPHYPDLTLDPDLDIRW